MSHDLENVVGGILLAVSLGLAQWLAYRDGAMMHPFSGSGDRETEPEKFRRGMIFYACLSLFFLGIALLSLHNLIS